MGFDDDDDDDDDDVMMVWLMRYASFSRIESLFECKLDFCPLLLFINTFDADRERCQCILKVGYGYGFSMLDLTVFRSLHTSDDPLRTNVPRRFVNSIWSIDLNAQSKKFLLTRNTNYLEVT